MDNALNNAWHVALQLRPYLQLCIEKGEFTLDQRGSLEAILAKVFDPKRRYQVNTTKKHQNLDSLLAELGQETADKRARRYDTVSRIKSLLLALEALLAATSQQPPRPHDDYVYELWDRVRHMAGDCNTIFVVIGMRHYSERVRIHVERLVETQGLKGAWAIYTNEETWQLYRTRGYHYEGDSPNVILPDLREQMHWIGGQYGKWELKT